MQHQIVITGYGACSPAGNSRELWDSVLKQKVHLETIRHPLYDFCPVSVIGRIHETFDNLFTPRMRPFISRHTRLGMSALQECINTAQIQRPFDRSTGLLFGSASIGQDQLQNVYANLLNGSFNNINPDSLTTVTDAGACYILATQFGINGYVHAVEGASCSGMLAIAEAYHAIQNGLCERIFCVSGEANHFPATYLYYSRKVRTEGITTTFFGKLKKPLSRSLAEYIVPFCTADISDRGAIAEGGAALLIESLDSAQRRKAPIYARIENVSSYFYSENFHGIDTKLTGLRNTLSALGKSIPDICYLPATGSYPIDYSYCSLLGSLYGGSYAFTVEPLIGHTGAASSLINIIIALKSLRKDILPPTRNFIVEKKVPSFTLIPLDAPIEYKATRALVVSAGWGGYNGACMLGKVEC